MSRHAESNDHVRREAHVRLSELNPIDAISAAIADEQIARAFKAHPCVRHARGNETGADCGGRTASYGAQSHLHLIASGRWWVYRNVQSAAVRIAAFARHEKRFGNRIGAA